MNLVGILFFSFGILLIILGISIFTPLFSWAGKKINRYYLSSFNYNQPASIRTTNLFIGICLFIFGLFITIASAAILDLGKIPDNQNSSVIKSLPQSVPATPETFPNPMVPEKKPPTPPLKNKQKSSISKYRLNCPPNIDGLNIRKKAGLNGEIISLIPCGAIEIQDTKQRDYQDGVEWFLVKYQQNIGWVAGKYLKQQANNSKNQTFSSGLFAKKRP